MNKPELLKKIIAHLTDRMELYGGAAEAARAEASDDENKAEDQYDTRGLEASYLAAGQSRQMAETAEAVERFAALRVRKFTAKDPIDLGAVVELKSRAERTHYFIGPCAGGTEVVHEKKTVLVITPESPLGEQLMGRKKGDRLKIKIAGVQNDYSVLSVS